MELNDAYEYITHVCCTISLQFMVFFLPRRHPIYTNTRRAKFNSHMSMCAVDTIVITVLTILLSLFALISFLSHRSLLKIHCIFYKVLAKSAT